MWLAVVKGNMIVGRAENEKNKRRIEVGECAAEARMCGRDFRSSWGDEFKGWAEGEKSVIETEVG